MKTNIVKALMSVSLLMVGSLAYSSGRDTTVTTNNCGSFMGQQNGNIKVECNFGGLNKAGDVVQWNTAGVQPTDLGKIVAAKEVLVSFPLEGAMKLYSFTATQGSTLVKNKPLKILFVAFDVNQAAPAGTPNSVIKEFNEGKKAHPGTLSMVKIYRQLTGEEATGWTEVATTFFPTRVSESAPLKATILPDAKVTFDQGNGELLIVDLAQQF